MKKIYQCEICYRTARGPDIIHTNGVNKCVYCVRKEIEKEDMFKTAGLNGFDLINKIEPPALSGLDAEVTDIEVTHRFYIQYVNERGVRGEIFDALDEQYGQLKWRCNRSGPLMDRPETGLMVIEVITQVITQV